MKKIPLLFLICIFFSLNKTQAQLNKLKEKIKQKVEQREERKTDQAIDKTLDKAEGVIDGTTQNGQTNQGTDAKPTETSKTTESEGLKAYSKFDFVPGEKLLLMEDFSQDVVGEVPLKWNTNGSGELVTLQGIPGKWLQLQEATKYQSPFKSKLPENYTIEFDVIFEFKDDQSVPWFYTIISGDALTSQSREPRLTFTLAPNHGNSASRDMVMFESMDKNGTRFLQATDKLNSVFYRVNHKKTPVHVAIWVQKQRFRAWLNQEKVYDLPQAVDPEAVFNGFGIELSSYGGVKENYGFYMSNLKIAAALPDTRSKLLTEGKWSTNGILFDVNSDHMNPSSYGVLKEVAATLSENPDVKVKIIGHTDSDGDDAKNLDLSKRRAAAVKAVLHSEFNIDESRMQTDGMGETKPVADNKSSEGKAQNRRVEFKIVDKA
ncbi:MAG: OmpA family protein, partial [Flavisolibacter sp.]